MARIVFGCCVGSWQRFEANVLPAANGSEVIGLGGQSSIAAAYNAILRSLAASFGPGDALVLVHDDLEIIDPGQAATRLTILEAAERHTISGPVGTAGEFTGIGWWAAGVVGVQQTDTARVGNVPARAAATALDGSCLIFGYRAVRSLRFDERYAWHGYDVDICRQARALDPWKADAVAVIPLATHHHSTLGFKSPKIEQDWGAADKAYRAKWREAPYE